MSTAILVVSIIVVAGVVAVVLGTLIGRRTRTQQLRTGFGPEYDRAVERHGDQAEAERELLERKRRHRELDIRSLDAGARERYRDEWARIQERFVDDPESVVVEADRLVTTVVTERGYPSGSFDERVAALSVDHGHTVDHYRRAHEIGDRAGRKDASTEDLRQAMVHYRALFEDLLGDGSAERDRRTEDRDIESHDTGERQAESRADDRQAEKQLTEKQRAEERQAEEQPADERRIEERQAEEPQAEKRPAEERRRGSGSTTRIEE
jgi:hypothetical protein